MDTRLAADMFNADKLLDRRRSPCEQFYKLVETLLWRNQAVAGLIEQNDRANFPFEGLTDEQRVLETIAKLDLNVANGGLDQFFWNCPIWADQIADSLRKIGLVSLAESFERSFVEWVAQIGPFIEFRKRDSLQAFSDCAGEFNFGNFDSEYWQNEEELYSKSVAYVMDHLEGFIAPQTAIQLETDS